MNYEKAYKETIDKLRKLHNNWDSTQNRAAKDIELVFPELIESEDEKIRKSLIKSFTNQHSSNFPTPEGFERKDILAWLEKQGGQDNNEDVDILQRFSFYSYKDEPNILYLSGLYVNEECRNKGIGTKILEVADEVAKSLNCHAIRLKTKKDSNAERLYRTHGYNSLPTKERDEIWLEKQGEQKPIERSLPYRKNETAEKLIALAECLEMDGDCLFNGLSGDDYGKFLRALAKELTEIKPKFKVGDIISDGISEVEIVNIDENKYNVTNGEIENDANICNWVIYFKDQENWKLVNKSYSEENEKHSQSKQEWSEEDEKMLTRIINEMEAIKSNSSTIFEKNIAQEKIDWIKSLRPQLHWKPSEEHMKVLKQWLKEHQYDGDSKYIYGVINSLYEQLKTL